MKPRTNRRQFLRDTGLIGAGVWAGLPLSSRTVLAEGKSPNEKLNIGMIGTGGKGADNIKGVSSENIVALCEVDETRLAKAAEQFPQAAKFVDFRKLLERNDIDAVVVTIPDHNHAVAANMAMKLGKHVYCEKPLVHDVYEARVLAKTAAEQKVATQMGNHGHSFDQTRRTVELIRSGAIGTVTEVHTWTDRPIWPQGIDRPTDTPPVPGTLAWDLWLGTAPERPYNEAYHPFKWRGWWDFGTSALGDMACHIMDPVFWALDLKAPSTVVAEGPPPHPDSAPKWMIVHYDFPSRGEMPAVKLHWYDGGKLPSSDLFEGEKTPDNGSLFVGDKGKLLYAHAGRPRLLPADRFKDFKAPEPTIPNSIGHYAEWIAACKASGSARNATGTNFAYAGNLTEAILLGNVAYRVGKKLEWDAPRMRATNAPEAAKYLKREYRKGWSL